MALINMYQWIEAQKGRSSEKTYSRVVIPLYSAVEYHCERTNF